MAVKKLLVKLLGPVGRWFALRRLRKVLGIDIRQIHVERNIVYGKGGDADLTLDLAMPREGDGLLPAVVLMAGGAWHYYAWPGLMEGILELLAMRGFVTIEPRYRLIAAAKFPGPVEDCKAAVRWLRANASRYRIDPNRIAALGPSSGGHLASMLGLTGPADGFEGRGGNPEQSSAVQAVVDLYGIVDFTDFPWRQQKEKGLITPFLGATFAENPDLYRKASPVEYVRPGAPPFLVIHGDQDASVPVGQSRRLAEKLQGVGADVKLIIVPGVGHGWGPPLIHETITQASEFLASRLGQKTP